MFKPGNVLYGTFKLSNICTKPKYAIILHNDGQDRVLATYTTSKKRSGVSDYVHGKNPSGSNDPKSYVFLASKEVGTYKDGNGVTQSFRFPEDSTVVPDYGYTKTSTHSLSLNVPDLTFICSLFEKEYLDLIYMLYQSKKTPREYKKIFEKISQDKLK